MMNIETRKKISTLAHRFYLRRGANNGSAVDDWLRAEKIVKRNEWLKRFILFVFLPSILFFFVLFFYFQFSPKVSTIVSLLFATLFFLGFNALNREPYNIQSEVIIAAAALLFTGMTILFQGFEFELRNRPYLRIIDAKLNLTTAVFRPTSTGPEPQFEISMNFVNHGAIPGTVTEVTIVAHPEWNKVFTQEAIPFATDLRDWVRVDIFPYLGNAKHDQWLLKRTFFLNLEHARKIGIEHVAKVEKPNPLQELFHVTSLPFYCAFQIKYFALNEVDKKRPYWYWILCQYKEGSFHFIDSGVDKRI